YLLAHGGRFDGRPLITFEGRAGYTLLRSTHLEGRLTLQLPASLRIACGASMDPDLMKSSQGGASRVGVTLERAVPSGSNLPIGMQFVGFRSGVSGTGSNR